jgi:ABC-type nitrate/sulfonate/bicarbonate transport system substrate-binding protein
MPVPVASLTRRALLLGSGAALLAAPAVAQAQTVRLTLPFVAQGATAFAFVARETGLFRRRGLESRSRSAAGHLPPRRLFRLVSSTSASSALPCWCSRWRAG